MGIALLRSETTEAETMKLPTRRPTIRREVTRVMMMPARGRRTTRTTLVVVGRDLAFDSSEEFQA